MLRRASAVVTACLVLAAVGCGEQASTLPHTERVTGEYRFEGSRRVDTDITVDKVVEGFKPNGLAPQTGVRYTAVTVSYFDRGADPFPRDWARLVGIDDQGRRVQSGVTSTTLRKRYPTKPVIGQPLTHQVAFPLREGRRLVAIELISIVKVWRFSGRWDLPDA